MSQNQKELLERLIRIEFRSSSNLELKLNKLLNYAHLIVQSKLYVNSGTTNDESTIQRSSIIIRRRLGHKINSGLLDFVLKSNSAKYVCFLEFLTNIGPRSSSSRSSVNSSVKNAAASSILRSDSSQNSKFEQNSSVHSLFATPRGLDRAENTKIYNFILLNLFYCLNSFDGNFLFQFVPDDGSYHLAPNPTNISVTSPNGRQNYYSQIQWMEQSITLLEADRSLFMLINQITEISAYYRLITQELESCNSLDIGVCRQSLHECIQDQLLSSYRSFLDLVERELLNNDINWECLVINDAQYAESKKESFDRLLKLYVWSRRPGRMLKHIWGILLNCNYENGDKASPRNLKEGCFLINTLFDIVCEQHAERDQVQDGLSSEEATQQSDFQVHKMCLDAALIPMVRWTDEWICHGRIVGDIMQEFYIGSRDLNLSVPDGYDGDVWMNFELPQGSQHSLNQINLDDNVEPRRTFPKFLSKKMVRQIYIVGRNLRFLKFWGSKLGKKYDEENILDYDGFRNAASSKLPSNLVEHLLYQYQPIVVRLYSQSNYLVRCLVHEAGLMNELRTCWNWLMLGHGEFVAKGLLRVKDYFHDSYKSPQEALPKHVDKHLSIQQRHVLSSRLDDTIHLLCGGDMAKAADLADRLDIILSLPDTDQTSGGNSRSGNPSSDLLGDAWIGASLSYRLGETPLVRLFPSDIIWPRYSKAFRLIGGAWSLKCVYAEIWEQFRESTKLNLSAYKSKNKKSSAKSTPLNSLKSNYSSNDIMSKRISGALMAKIHLVNSFLAELLRFCHLGTLEPSWRAFVKLVGDTSNLEHPGRKIEENDEGEKIIDNCFKETEIIPQILSKNTMLDLEELVVAHRDYLDRIIWLLEMVIDRLTKNQKNCSDKSIYDTLFDYARQVNMFLIHCKNGVSNEHISSDIYDLEISWQQVLQGINHFDWEGLWMEAETVLTNIPAA